MYFKNISNILVSIFDLMNFFVANWLTNVKLSNSVIHSGPIEIEMHAVLYAVLNIQIIKNHLKVVQSYSIIL